MSDARTAMEMVSDLSAELNQIRGELRDALDALAAVYEYETDDTTGPWPAAVAILRKHGRTP